jgi:AraC-like DNA-binding protein
MQVRLGDITAVHEFGHFRRLLFMPDISREGAFDCYRLEETHLHKDEKLYRKGVQVAGLRASFYDISFFTLLSSQFEHSVNNCTNKLESGAIHFIAPGQLQSIYVPPQSTVKGYTLTFKPEFLNTGLENSRFQAEFPFFSITANAILHLEEKETRLFIDVFERIFHEYHENQLFGESVIRSLVLTLLYYAKRLFAAQNQETVFAFNDRASQLTQAYRDLLYKHVCELKKVSDFAEMLHISPDYLKECTQKTVGKSAQQLLSETKQLEAESLLLQTRLSVAEVSHRLGFENPSNFFHFFKRMSGTTPAEFRAKA